MFVYLFFLAGKKDEYDLAEFAAYDEENVEDAAAGGAAKEKKETEKDAFRSMHAAGFREVRRWWLFVFVWLFL